MPTMAQNRIYRKKMCPWGQKAVQLLDEHSVSYQDHLFDSKDEEMQFKHELAVSTTPQIFLNGKHIGGYRELQQYLASPDKHESKSSLWGLIWILIASALLAFVTELNLKGFLGFALTLFASLKIMDLKSFARRFTQYDLICVKLPQYAFVFPFIQLILGLALLVGYFYLALSIVAIITGLVGLAGIIKSLYIDKNSLKCSSIGGYYPVPLTLSSLTEYIILLLIGVILVL